MQCHCDGLCCSYLWEYTICLTFSRFLNQVCAGPHHLVFWNCFGSHVSMCVLCVCLPSRALITSGVIWCDINCVWLVKQVLRLFPAFSCFIWQLPSIKWMGVALLTQRVMNACQRRLRWRSTSYRRTTLKTEHFSYKGEWVATHLKECKPLASL